MKQTFNTQKLVLGAILTALVIVLQLLGSFVRFGPFAISLVLLPITIGAALCGTKTATWLGAVFGVVVLFTDAAGFLAISIPGTVITVLLKGALCGLCAGLVYRLLEKKSRLAAVVAAAIVCPLVNTGVFVLGCFVFFFDAVAAWGVDAGFQNAVSYVFLGMIGLNFLVELGINALLSPIAARLLSIRSSQPQEI